MAIAYNTSIVRNGLVLHLDAANPKSYPGSGTAWFDLSGNGNTGTLTSGPTYNSVNNGTMVFDGVDDSVDIGAGYTQQIFSVEFVVKPGSSQLTYADIIDNNHTGTRSWVIQQNATSLNQYYFYTMADAPVFTLATNQWSHVVCTFNSQTNSKNIYVNGVLVNTGVAPVITYDGTEFLRLGRWGGSGRHWNGQNSLTRFYNRVLTAAEIQQNFEALRGRYGI